MALGRGHEHTEGAGLLPEGALLLELLQKGASGTVLLLTREVAMIAVVGPRETIPADVVAYRLSHRELLLLAKGKQGCVFLFLLSPETAMGFGEVQWGAGCIGRRLRSLEGPRGTSSCEEWSWDYRERGRCA